MQMPLSGNHQKVKDMMLSGMIYGIIFVLIIYQKCTHFIENMAKDVIGRDRGVERFVRYINKKGITRNV